MQETLNLIRIDTVEEDETPGDTEDERAEETDDDTAEEKVEKTVENRGKVEGSWWSCYLQWHFQKSPKSPQAPPALVCADRRNND